MSYYRDIILSITVPETDARRLVLRGRRTITRHYNRGLAIPAWAIIVIVALCQLVIGVVLYFVMRKFVLSGTSNSNSYTPAGVPVSSRNKTLTINDTDYYLYT
ncbi:hypothetical protein Bhyg_13534, partial [Pseudolycoriella hygida]